MARPALLITSLLCTGAILLCLRAEAQENGPVQFHGVSHLTWQTASQQGPWQQLPPSFLRWDLNSVLNLYGLPISVQALATTEEGRSYQHINAFSIGLSRADLQDQIRRRIDERIEGLSSIQSRLAGLTPEAAADSLRALGSTITGGVDPDALITKLQDLRDLKETDLQARMDELQSMGLASATQGIASLFPMAVIGVTYPSYTRLTVDGTALTGLQLEFTPGPFYLALAGGQVQTAAGAFSSWTSVFEDASYRRTLAAGRMGVGARDDTHFFLNVVYGTDDPGSLTRDSLHRPVTPEKTAVVGVDGRLFLFEDRLELGGEAAYSVRTADVQAAGPADGSIPSWLGSITDANLTSIAGNAVAFDGIYRFAGSGTSLSADFRRVGSGYASPGVPYLRKDNLRFEGKAEQTFAGRQLSVAAFYRRDEDDLSGARGWGTTIDAFGAQVSVNPRNLPYLRLSYAPLSQVSHVLADSLKIESDVLAVSGASGYTYRSRGGLTSFTMLSVNYHEGKTQIAGGRYLSRNLMFFQSIGFTFPLSVQVVAGLMGTDIGSVRTSIVNSDFSATYSTPGNWQTSAGVSLSRDAIRRTGVYLRSSAPAWKGGLIELFAERSLYEDPADSFNESLLRVVVTQTW